MEQKDRFAKAGDASSEKTAPRTGGWFGPVEEMISFYLNGAIIFCVMCLISIEIVSRYFFNFSFMGVVDIVELSMLILAFTSLSGVQREDKHIKVDLIERKLKGRPGGRALHLFNRLLTLIVSAVLFYIAVMAALEAYQDNILTWMIFLPKWPAVFFIPIGWLLLCIRVGIQIRQSMAAQSS